MIISVKFYFDFCDFKSYLVAAQIAKWRRLPCRIEWVAIDSLALRAQSDEAIVAMAQDAMGRRLAGQFAQFHQIALQWPANQINSELALRLMSWIGTQHTHDTANFAFEILRQVWGNGRALDASLLEATLADFGFKAQQAFEQARDGYAFRLLDARNREAFEREVVDVPTLEVGDEAFVGYERVDMAAEYVLSSWLRACQSDRLCDFVARELLRQNESERTRQMKVLEQLFGTEVTQTSIAATHDNDEHFVHELYAPRVEPIVELSVDAPMTDLYFSFASPASTADAQAAIVAAFENSKRDELTILSLESAPSLDLKKLEKALLARQFDRRFLLVVHDAPHDPTMVLSIAAPTRECVEITTHDATRPLQAPIFTIGSWHIAICTGAQSDDLKLARHIARQGSHVLLFFSPISANNLAAISMVTQRWVIGPTRKGYNLTDKNGQRRYVEGGDVFAWPPTLGDAEVSRIDKASTRERLIVDLPCCIGDVEHGDDLSLACIGDALSVETSEQQSLLSAARISSRIHFGDKSIVILPVYANHILAVDYLVYKMVEATRRNPANAAIVIVNYWQQLRFTKLERLRCLYRTIVEQWGVSVVVVSARQCVELWESNVRGSAYRAEKERHNTIVDLACTATPSQIASEMQKQWGEDLSSYLESR